MSLLKRMALSERPTPFENVAEVRRSVLLREQSVNRILAYYALGDTEPSKNTTQTFGDITPTEETLYQQAIDDVRSSSNALSSRRSFTVWTSLKAIRAQKSLRLPKS